MTPGAALALGLLVVAFLLAIFAIENYFSSEQRAWQRIVDDLGEAASAARVLDE